MLKPLIATCVGLAAAASLGACTTQQLTSALANATGQLGGTIYAPADQVAVIAQGGGNLVGPSGGTYKVESVAAGQTGIPGATVQVRNAGTDTLAATTVTSDSGNFTANVPGGVLYHVQSSFNAKSGGTVSVNGFAEIDALSPCQLDVAHNMVASKLLSRGVSRPDYNAFKAAVASMEEDLSSVPRIPQPTDQASAAAAFDSTAKTASALVAAMGNTQ